MNCTYCNASIISAAEFHKLSFCDGTCLARWVIENLDQAAKMIQDEEDQFEWMLGNELKLRGEYEQVRNLRTADQGADESAADGSARTAVL